MIPPSLIAGAVQGLSGVASGIIGHKKRVQEQKAAQGEFDVAKAAYMAQDVSNPYTNMQNTMEDLTVNTQAADFAAQQQAQGMASTMDAMSGAAGGSGIAALAQSLANAQSQNAQQASASIAQQEAGNQAAAAQMAGELQSMERQGEVLSRNMQREQLSTELGMSQGRLSEANMARQQATQALIGGVGDLATSFVGLKAKQAGIGGGPSIWGMLAGTEETE